MRAFLVVLLATLLAPLPAAGSTGGVDASATGTTTFRATDPWTGQALCEGNAAFTVEANALAGAVAWEAPACPSYSPGVQPFSFWCTDACFHDCWFFEDAMTCERDGTRLTLARDGAFTFERDAGTAWVTAEGVLMVTTWPT